MKTWRNFAQKGHLCTPPLGPHFWGSQNISKKATFQLKKPIIEPNPPKTAKNSQTVTKTLKIHTFPLKIQKNAPETPFSLQNRSKM